MARATPCPPAPSDHRASDRRYHSPAAPGSATPRAPRVLPVTRTATAHSTTLLWATPMVVLALWGRLLPLGALLWLGCLANSALHTFPLAGQSQHLLLSGQRAYHTCEDLPF